MSKIETLVDEGFRVSLIETAFFDGKFEIPHIDAPKDIVVPVVLYRFHEGSVAVISKTLFAFTNTTLSSEKF